MLHRNIKIKFVAAALVLINLPAFAQETKNTEAFSYHLIGLPKNLANAIKARLDSLSSQNITVEGRYRAQVRRNVRDGLRALGYYDATMKLFWEEGNGSKDFFDKNKKEKTLFVNVSLGEPVRINGNRVVIKGDGANDETFNELLKKVPEDGQILHHGNYDSFVSELTKTSMRRGYFDAKFNERVLAVAPKLHKAGWWVEYDTQTRYKYGDIRFEGSQINTDYLYSLVKFKSADPYESREIADLNAKLSETGWFNSVVVTPEPNKDTHEVDVVASLTPRTKNNLELGLGFATDTGPHVKATWTKPWINEDGHSLEFDSAVSAYEQFFDVSYRIPKKSDPINEYYLIQAGFKRTDVEDTLSNSAEALISRYKILNSGWQRVYNLHASVSNFTQGKDENTTWLIYPGVGFSRTRSKGGLMPTWGDTQRYEVDVSSRIWGSDVNFAVLNVQQAWIRTLAQANRFVVRGQLGAIAAGNFDVVPPDLRFFAGGDRSIRGWDYKSVSPKDSSGKATGAKRLLTASVEYQRNVTGNWWLAAFADAGEAVNDFRDSDFKFGAGLGVRWNSPFGPVKLDVAMPVNKEGKKTCHFYLGLGPEL